MVPRGPSFGIHSAHAHRALVRMRERTSLAPRRPGEPRTLLALALYETRALLALALCETRAMLALALYKTRRSLTHAWQSAPPAIRDIRAVPRKVCVNICVETHHARCSCAHLISHHESLRIIYAFDLHCNAAKKTCEALTLFTAFLSSTKSLRIGQRARELYAGLVHYVSAWRPRTIAL